MPAVINPTQLLVQMALDLSSSISAEDRHKQLLDTILKGIPCDAAALLRFSGNTLRPIAVKGMTKETLDKRFIVREHPRLNAILNAHGVMRFAADDPRPDPFDGLITHSEKLLDVHSCMGTALYVGDQLVGALTLDAHQPHQFDDVNMQLFEGFSAMAAAAFKVANQFEGLERTQRNTNAAVQGLLEDAIIAQGGALLGTSETIDRVREDLGRVASSALTVLITGERGTQRALAARILHRQSGRTTLIPVACGSLGDNPAERLFGQQPSTGPSSVGLLEQADGGTLLLRDVQLLPIQVQEDLLRALQQQRVHPLGASLARPIDVRVVATADQNLIQHLRNGAFSADLYRYISVFPIAMPTLDQRLEDLPALVESMLRDQRSPGEVIDIHPDAFALLQNHLWTEHVHELRCILSGATTRLRASKQTMIWPRHLLTPALAEEVNNPQTTPGVSLRDAVDQFQAKLIREAVSANHGNWSAAARALGVDRGNLHRMAKRLDLMG